MLRWFFLLILMNITIGVFAQDEASTNNIIANIIEDFLESNDAENFDYNTIFENLNYYYDHPININTAKEEELRDLFLLNEIQINGFLQHRQTFGNFLSIYELQSIPSWDMITIKNVTPFLQCEIAPVDFNLDFRDAFRNGTSTLFLKGKEFWKKEQVLYPTQMDINLM